MKNNINISFRKKIGGGDIRLSIALLDGLGYPEHVRLLINQDTYEVGVQASNKKDLFAVKVLYSDRSVEHGATICSKIACDRIFELCSWDDDRTYRASDYYVTNSNIFIFRLSNAKDASRLHTRGPKSES